MCIRDRAETNRISADLVGLTPAQFQQVVLLPQGRFQEVLHASSDERTKLLRTLFDTAGFERAQELLDRRAKTAETRRNSMIDDVSRSEDTANAELDACLLYTSDAADDLLCVDLGGRRIIKKKNRLTHQALVIYIHNSIYK